jgi:hypothetical protein
VADELLAVRATGLRASTGLTSRRREDRREDTHGGERTDEVDGEAPCAHLVDHDEEPGGEHEDREPSERQQRRPAKPVSRIARRADPLVERPVRELGGEKHADGDGRRCEVEPRIVDRKLRRVAAGDDRDSGGDQSMPALYDPGEERDDGDRSDPDADRAEVLVGARQRNRRDGEEAGDRSCSGRYACTGYA